MDLFWSPGGWSLSRMIEEALATLAIACATASCELGRFLRPLVGYQICGLQWRFSWIGIDGGDTQENIINYNQSSQSSKY